MTTVLLDMTFRSSRDAFFLQPHCLGPLLRHAYDCVKDVVDMPVITCLTNKYEEMEEFFGEGTERLQKSVGDELDPGVSWLEIGKRLFASLDDPSSGDLLYVNPLQGPLCRKRLRNTIAAGEGRLTSVSAVSMSVNEHPLWVDQLPDRYAGKTSFVLRGRRSAGSLRRNGDFVQSLQRDKGKKIEGSQNLGQVFKLDGACAYYPRPVVENGLRVDEFVWSPWVKNGDTDIPWFYAVPIWTMARTTPVRINNWDGGR